MTRRRYYNTLREKPYLIDAVRRIGKSELDAIIAKEGIPDFFEVLQAAKQKAPHLDWPDISRFDPSMQQETPSIINPVFRLRKLVIGVASALLIAFLSFTTPGRAIVSKAVELVTRIAHNIIYFWDQNRTSEFNEPMEPGNAAAGEHAITEPTVYTAIEDFTGDTMKLPVIVENDRITFMQITADPDNEGRFIATSDYVTSDEKRVRLTQIWIEPNREMIPSGVGIGEGDSVLQKVLPGSVTINYIITQDGVMSGYAIIGQSIVEIAAEPGVDIDDLFESISIP